MASAGDDPRTFGEIRVGRASAPGAAERWHIEASFPLNYLKGSHATLATTYAWGDGRVSLVYETEKLVVADVNLEIRNAIAKATVASNAAQPLSYRDMAEAWPALTAVAEAGFSFFKRLIPTVDTVAMNWFSKFDSDGDLRTAVLQAFHDWLDDVPEVNIVTPEPGLFPWPLLYGAETVGGRCDHSRFWASRTLRIQPFGLAASESLQRDWRAVAAVDIVDRQIGSFGRSHFAAEHPFGQAKSRVNSSEPTLKRCFSRLPEVDIFYFFGHAGLNANGTGWFLSRASDVITARQIEDLFTTTPCNQVSPSRPVVVILNGCDTAGPTKEPETIPMVMSRARKRCFYFLTALAPIPGWAAAEFARMFLQTFLAGESLVDSVHQARQYLWDRYFSPVGMFYLAEGFYDVRLRGKA